MSRLLRPAIQVTDYVRRLAPEHRRSIKRALEELRGERGDIQPLENNLAGYYRLRVGKYRIIFSYAEDDAIEALFIEERSLVYEIFEAHFVHKLRQ